MTGMQLIFLLDALVTVVAGVMLATSRKLVHAALWLVLTLFGVAVVFGLLEASFMAVVQVVVYIGAIAILIVFAIMLTREAVEDTHGNKNRWILTSLVGVITLAGILLAMLTWPQMATLTLPLPQEQMSIAELGMALVDPERYLVPFEVASILLLAALVGAVYVAMERKMESK